MKNFTICFYLSYLRYSFFTDMFDKSDSSLCSAQFAQETEIQTISTLESVVIYSKSLVIPLLIYHRTIEKKVSHVYNVWFAYHHNSERNAGQLSE